RRRGDQRLLGRGHAAAVLREQREALILEPGEFLGRPTLVAAAIRAGHFGAAPLEDRRQRQHARTADAAEEPGVSRKVGGGGGHRGEWLLLPMRLGNCGARSSFGRLRTERRR